MLDLVEALRRVGPPSAVCRLPQTTPSTSTTLAAIQNGR